METNRCPFKRIGGCMFRKLPAAGTLDDFKKEARGLLHGLHRSDASAITKYISFDPGVYTFPIRLTDAQYVIARMYGCKSWKELEERVRRTYSRKRVSSLLSS
jgi:hypothetical protein